MMGSTEDKADAMMRILGMIESLPERDRVKPLVELAVSLGAHPQDTKSAAFDPIVHAIRDLPVTYRLRVLNTLNFPYRADPLVTAVCRSKYSVRAYPSERACRTLKPGFPGLRHAGSGSRQTMIATTCPRVSMDVIRDAAKPVRQLFQPLRVCNVRRMSDRPVRQCSRIVEGPNW